jgi:hypothetical protein
MSERHQEKRGYNPHYADYRAGSDEHCSIEGHGQYAAVDRYIIAEG